MRVFAIYFVFAFLFAPALLLFISGALLITSVVVMELFKGGFSSIVYMWPVIGGGVGLAAATVLVIKLAGKPAVSMSTGVAVVGVLVGVVTEAGTYFYFTPAPEPTLIYWLPPVVGAALLLVASAYQHASRVKSS
jgi:hypothetical protein